MTTNLLPDKCTCIRWVGDDPRCPAHGEDAAWDQLQSIRAIDAELARRGEPVRPGWLSADPKQGGQR